MKNKGFTLVELLVVISIIAILSVLGISLFGGVQQKARDTQRRADINAIKAALEQRFDATSATYPSFSTPPVVNGLISTWFANSEIPVDPVSSAHYQGIPLTTPFKTFKICATMESAGGVDDDSGTAGTQACVNNQQQ